MPFTNHLTFRRLRELNVRRCEEAFHPIYDWSPGDWMTAVAGEVGEAANLLKKMRRGDPDEIIATADVAKELADAVIYIDLLAARLEINLGEAVADKFDEVSRRRGWDGESMMFPGSKP